MPSVMMHKCTNFRDERRVRTVYTCRGPAPMDPGNSKVGKVLVSLEITYLITDREGLEN